MDKVRRRAANDLRIRAVVDVRLCIRALEKENKDKQ